MGLIVTSSILWSFVVLCRLLVVVAVIDDLVVVLGQLVFVEAEGINNSVTRLCLKLLEHMAVNRECCHLIIVT